MNAMKQMLMYQIKRGASKELQTIIEAHCDDFEKQEKATELLYSIIKLVQNEDMFSEKEIRYMIAQRIQWYGYLTLQLIEDVITWFMDMQCNSDASPGYSQLGSIRIPVIYFSSAGLSRLMNYMDSVMCESHLAHISSAVSCLVGFSCSLSWTMESWSIKNERQTLSREVKNTDKEMEYKKILLPFQIKSTEGLSHLWDKFGEEKRSGHLVKISDTLSNIFGVDIRVKTSIDTDQFQGALHAEKLYSMSSKMKADRRKMKISRIAG
ncbi:uncharacterized protein LOC128553414, partial [Mercenaria mercenaria]|uniref:uncharacterized protein LOC128553414 n=1 Tax=Mercenaria mercenaria TaxID=6596 RepID=UPI00234F5994